MPRQKMFPKPVLPASPEDNGEVGIRNFKRVMTALMAVRKPEMLQEEKPKLHPERKPTKPVKKIG